MSSESDSAPTDPLEYKLIVSVPGDERAIQFQIGGMLRLPRTGDKLDFDGPENENLTLKVIEVRHAFGVRDEPSVCVYAILDHESGDPEHLYTAQRLLEGPELERWTSHFAMLSPGEDTVAYRSYFERAARGFGPDPGRS